MKDEVRPCLMFEHFQGPHFICISGKACKQLQYLLIEQSPKHLEHVRLRVPGKFV